MRHKCHSSFFYSVFVLAKNLVTISFQIACYSHSNNLNMVHNYENCLWHLQQQDWIESLAIVRKMGRTYRTNSTWCYSYSSAVMFSINRFSVAIWTKQKYRVCCVIFFVWLDDVISSQHSWVNARHRSSTVVVSSIGTQSNAERWNSKIIFALMRLQHNGQYNNSLLTLRRIDIQSVNQQQQLYEVNSGLIFS